MKQITKVDNTVYFVSCVGEKLPRPATAKDLYASSWFKKARRFAESRGCPWFILSAEYGLVSPDQIIEPYEKTLNNMPIADRRKWADRVNSQIQAVIPQFETAVFLAGQRYREFLIGHLQKRKVAIEVPIEGLKIGEQLSWLGKNGG